MNIYNYTNPRKRKHRPAPTTPFPASSSTSTSTPFHPDTEPDAESTHQNQDPLQPLYIQAHEADIIRGSGARIAAQSLQVVEYVGVRVQSPEAESDDGSVTVQRRIGSALIQIRLHGAGFGAAGAGAGFGASSAASSAIGGTRNHTHPIQNRIQIIDEDDENNTGVPPPPPPTNPILQPSPSALQDDDSLWVDRYDIRLLLDSSQLQLHGPYPSSSSHWHSSHHSSQDDQTWSDLPSDTEDTFFFSPSEREDFRREKRRKIMERKREERVDALRRVEEEEFGGGGDGDGEGGSDEEARILQSYTPQTPELTNTKKPTQPTEPQKELMRRTAAHLLSSPNPAQLEMRILANHGRDRRFAFLRGRRWGRWWDTVREEVRREREREREEKEKEKEKEKEGLGGLLGYGSGSSDDGDDDDGEEDQDTNTKNHNPTTPPPPSAEDLKAIEARRDKLRAWMEKRRAAQAARVDEKDANAEGGQAD